MFQFLEDSIIRSFYLLGAESARDDNSVGDNKVFRVTATKCSLTVISLTVKQGELCRRQACLKFPSKSQNNPHALAVMMYNNIYIYILPLRGNFAEAQNRKGSESRFGRVNILRVIGLPREALPLRL